MDRTDGVKPWVVKWGRTSWLLAGMAVLVSIVVALCSTLSGIVYPLVVALVIATLAVPVIDWCEERRIPKWVGAFAVILGLAAVVAGSFVITVQGVLDQAGEIDAVISNGLDEINEWLADNDIDTSGSSAQTDQIGEMAGPVVGGIAAQIGSIFSGLVAFGFGVFLATLMLFYLLTDFANIQRWVGGHLGVPADLGAAILDDSVHLLRRGFAALTLSSLCTAVLIGLTMLALDLPLAFTVAIVTFVTSYVPYIGAIFAGAFGFLVALGAGGLQDAIILLIVILIVQNVVQTVVGNRLTSHTLSIHPIGSLIATIVGGIVAGFLGAMLAAPVVAMLRQVARRVSESQHGVGVEPASSV